MVDQPLQDPAATVITTVNAAMIPAALRAVSESCSIRRAVGGSLSREICRFGLGNLSLAMLSRSPGRFVAQSFRLTCLWDTARSRCLHLSA